MNFSRRQFVKGGVTAFTFGFAAPQMLCDIALAQGVPSRNLVVVYLSGGNDSLSTVIPYRDAAYASRRPTLAIPAGSSRYYLVWYRDACSTFCLPATANATNNLAVYWGP